MQVFSILLVFATIISLVCLSFFFPKNLEKVTQIIDFERFFSNITIKFLKYSAFFLLHFLVYSFKNILLEGFFFTVFDVKIYCKAIGCVIILER